MYVQIKRFESKTTRYNNFEGKKILFTSCTGRVDLPSFEKLTRNTEVPILLILFLL